MAVQGGEMTTDLQQRADALRAKANGLSVLNGFNEIDRTMMDALMLALEGVHQALEGLAAYADDLEKRIERLEGRSNN